MPVPSPDLSPTPVAVVSGVACAPRSAPAGPLAVALAGPPDSLGASDPSLGVPRLLAELAAAGAVPPCPHPRPGEPASPPVAVPDTVIVRRVGDRGARDALDRGADILVTRDPSVVAYAAGSPGLVSVPLPWDRVYVLVVPRQPARPDSAAAPLRAALASDAVHADARAFGTGTMMGTLCGGNAAPPRNAIIAPALSGERVTVAARILYDQEDSVARYLAERMAVLTSTGSSLVVNVAPALGRLGAEVYATGLPASELPRAMMDARGAASIVATSSPALLCGGSGAFRASGSVFTIQTGDREAAIVPLIETRAWAIVRRDAVSRIAALGGQGVVAEERTP